MHKLAIVFLFILCPAFLFAGTNNKLKISINKNVELLGLAYFIAFEGVDIETKTMEIGGKQVPKKEWHNYGFYIYEKYKSFASSEHLAKGLGIADHLWLDYLISLLLQVDETPNAKLKESINESYYINFSKKKDPVEAKQNVIIFLEGLNGFHKGIEFEKYFIETKVYYDKAIEETRQALPKEDFIGTMETFYRSGFDSYNLVPSLTIPKGMGFGLRYTLDGKTNIFNVFGAFGVQQFQNTTDLKMGFDDKTRLRELSVHEFGHSFVNRTVDQLPKELITQTEKLFEPLKTAMSNQGYNNWHACLYEHFVRTGEIIIAEKLGDKEGARKLQSDYEQNRQFRYIPVMLVELKNYDKDSKKSYYDAVLASMQKLARN